MNEGAAISNGLPRSARLRRTWEFQRVRNEGERAVCGCLIVNTAAELALRDPEVAKYVGAGFDAIEEELYCALARARADGQISTARTPRQLARFFLNTNIGLQVMHKTPGRKKAASEIVTHALAQLD